MFLNELQEIYTSSAVSWLWKMTCPAKVQGHEVSLKSSVKVKNFRCRFVVLLQLWIVQILKASRWFLCCTDDKHAYHAPRFFGNDSSAFRHAKIIQEYTSKFAWAKNIRPFHLILFVVVLFMDFSTFCSLHVICFLLMRFIFEDWLAKGHAGAAAWPLHITPTASFIKNDQICTKSVEVLCIETIMWLFHFEHWALLRPSEANIIMTQPRRISAIGVADRIANEMNTGHGSLNIFEQSFKKIHANPSLHPTSLSSQTSHTDFSMRLSSFRTWWFSGLLHSLGVQTVFSYQDLGLHHRPVLSVGWPDLINHPKTSKNPVTGWQMCSELIRNCPRLEITGVKISETRYDSNINKLGIWISFMCICRLHEFFWIWQSDILQLKRCASPTVGKWSSITQCDAYHCRRMLCPQAIFWCERCKWN